MRTELVTTLKRKATEMIAEIQADGLPVLITEHGRPAAYLVDVASYVALRHRLAIMEGIARGERAIEEGRTLTHAKARQRMARWLK